MTSSFHPIADRMLGQNPSQPAFFQMVDIDSLIPRNHRLRQIDAALDLSFVREAVADCYTPRRGRPSIDPELAVRMMILGVLYNLSDRQLCDEIRMHAGFRWFCRLNFHDSVPDHSTLSRLRNERWAKSELFTRLFEEVLHRCAEAGMISGRHVSADGTQIQANASMQSLVRSEKEKPSSESKDPPEGGGDPPNLHLAVTKEDRAKAKGSAAFKDPQPQGTWQARGERFTNETHVSRTDPEAKLYKKGGAGARLSYLVHDVIDTKSRVILGRRASVASSAAERKTALELLNEHEARRESLGLKQAVEVLSADGGYGTGEFVADVVDRGITPHVPLQGSHEMEEIPTWKRPTCNLEQYRKRREALRQALARNEVRGAYRKHGYTVSRKLRTRSEHIFAEAKNEHGMGRARHRGLERINRHSLLIAAVQNLKRLTQTLRRQANAASAIFGYLRHLLDVLRSMVSAETVWPGIRRFLRSGIGFKRQIRVSSILHLQPVNCSTAL